MQYRKKLKYAVISSLFLLIFAIFFGFYLLYNKLQEIETVAQANQELEQIEELEEKVPETDDPVIPEIFQEFPELHYADTALVSERALIFSKETIGADAIVTADVSYVDFLLQITICGYDDSMNLSDNDIYRRTREYIYQGKPSEKVSNSDDFICSIIIGEPELGESGANIIQVQLKTTNIYECQVTEDQNYFYLTLQRPKEMYDKIVTVDAGHGGKDSGTPTAGELHYEKKYNLAMLLELKNLLEKEEDIKVYYTRVEDRSLTLNQRVDMANDLEADLFLSFHCNSSDISTASGMEVLYSETQDDLGLCSSKQFAKLCMDEINERFLIRNRGIVPRSEDVHIIGAANMPVALIEAAYLSNASDLTKISKESNQRLIAEGAYHAILKYFEGLMNETNIDRRQGIIDVLKYYNA